MPFKGSNARRAVVTHVREIGARPAFRVRDGSNFRSGLVCDDYEFLRSIDTLRRDDAGRAYAFHAMCTPEEFTSVNLTKRYATACSSSLTDVVRLLRTTINRASKQREAAIVAAID